MAREQSHLLDRDAILGLLDRVADEAERRGLHDAATEGRVGMSTGRTSLAVRVLGDSVLPVDDARVLRWARTRSGLTQQQAARLWGRSQPQVARVESTSIEQMQVGTLRSFVAALGGTCRIVIEVDGETAEVPAGDWSKER